MANVTGIIEDMGELEKLFDIEKRWIETFKANVLEDIFEKYDSLKEFINILIKDWMPIWMEDTETREEYIQFLKEFKALDIEKLEKEYKAEMEKI